MDQKRIVKNYFYNTAYQILIVLTPLITAPYIARVLGVTAVSQVNYVYSILTYFVLFGTAGSSLYGQREIAYYQSDPVKRSTVFKEILTLRIILVSISILVYFATCVTFGKYRTLYLLMIFELIAAMFDVSWLFQGLEDFKKTVIRNVIVKLFGIALLFIFVKSPADVNKYSICFTLPTLIGNLSLWAYLPKVVVKSPFVFSELKKYFKPMLALFLPQVATDVYTVLDKTMIGVFAPNFDDVGYYTYSQHIVKMLLQLITSLGIVALPAMANAFSEKRTADIEKMMDDSFKFVFVLGSPIMFGLAAVSSSLVGWFYGPGYSAVGGLIALICPIVLLIGISTVVGRQYLLPCQRQSAFTVSVIMGAGVNFVLNFILIRHFGAVGASVATVVSELTVVAVQIYFVRKDLPLIKYFKANIKYILFGAVMFVSVYPINHFLDGVVCTFVQVFTGVTVYTVLLAMTKDPLLVKYFNKAKSLLRRAK